MRSILFALLILSYHGISFAEQVPFTAALWEIKAEESKFVEHLGRQALSIKGGQAAVKNSQFVDGMIEFDIALTPERNFAGVFWRMQDFDNYEEFYVRPHQSGFPDANQYEPVFHGNAAWQLYHGKGYSSTVQYEWNKWTHIKIVVSGQSAEIYINDMDQPSLFVSEMKRMIAPGKVGVSSSDFAAAYFSNFSYVPKSGIALKGKPEAPEPGPPGTVTGWEVSGPFDGKILDSKFELTAADKQNLKWQTLKSEVTGITNLGQLYPVTDTQNTVFARLKLESASDEIKKIKFGFSDEVKVYVNDRLIFKGSDSYRSRDYRFLGTIGYFDEIYLPLKKGPNEVLFAVTENFGGWGIQAVVEDFAD